MHFEYSESAHSPQLCRCHFGQDHTAAERADGRLPFVEDDVDPFGRPAAVRREARGRARRRDTA